MIVACSFCKQVLIEAYRHVFYEYAVCLNCYNEFRKRWKVDDFQRVSLLGMRGNQRLSRTKRVNDQLREFLMIRKLSICDLNFLQAIDEFFYRFNESTKSRFSDTSTSPSQGIQQQQGMKQKTSRLQSFFQAKAQENKNIQRLFQIKDLIAEKGSFLIQKIKENQKVEKQVENLNSYKQRLLETGGEVKNKFFKLKNEVKDMSSQLPSIRQTLKSVSRLGFFKKW